MALVAVRGRGLSKSFLLRWRSSELIKPISTVPQPSSDPSVGNRVFFLRNSSPEILEFSEALRALRAYSMSEIPETVDLSIKVNMTLKSGKVRDSFRGSLIYPHPFGSQSKILLIAEGASEIATGADIVGGKELIRKLDSGDPSLQFDVCLCTPEIYEKMKHLQKKLRTKMPNPRRGTVLELEEVRESVRKFQQSREFKCDKHGYINMPVGKLDFPDKALSENVKTLVDCVTTHKQHLPKGSFIKRGVLSTTYGPGFYLNLNHFL